MPRPSTPSFYLSINLPDGLGAVLARTQAPTHLPRPGDRLVFYPGDDGFEKLESQIAVNKWRATVRQLEHGLKPTIASDEQPVDTVDVIADADPVPLTEIGSWETIRSFFEDNGWEFGPPPP